MMKFSNPMILFCSFLLAFLLLSCSSAAREVDDEREFNYDEESEIGPSHWGEIHHEWSACGNGSMQSPIDLLNQRVEVVSHLGNIKRSYKPSNATLRNRGHDMMLEWVNGAGHVEINGTKYELQQCHWHSPSEHTINGKRFDLEAHMVHESAAGNTVVIGILYQLGKPDSFLSLMEEKLEEVAGTSEEEKVVGIVDPKLIKINSRKYYRYIGSLTVPPCTENVSWTIIKKIRTVSREQLELLRVAVHDESNSNARPLQPLNKRTVELYRPRDNGRE